MMFKFLSMPLGQQNTEAGHAQHCIWSMTSFYYDCFLNITFISTNK